MFYVMLVITMAIEVLRREIFAFSSIWGEEIVRYSFIYLAWIGAAAAVKERAHIRIDVVMHYLSPGVWALSSGPTHQHYERFAKYLEHRGSMEYIARRIEEIEEQINDGRVRRYEDLLPRDETPETPEEDA